MATDPFWINTKKSNNIPFYNAKLRCKMPI